MRLPDSVAASSLGVGSPPFAAGGIGSETVCTVTACLSFTPATPTSRGCTPAARASIRTASSVVSPRFSKVT